MGMNVEVGGTFQHAEGRNQSHQAEAVVAVEVRNEDVVQPAELQFGAAELHLCPFAAVNHEQLLADVKHLRGRLMAGSGQGRTASQDVYVEFFHSYDSNWVFRMSPVSAYAICILKALRSDIGVWQDFPSESFR